MVAHACLLSRLACPCCAVSSPQLTPEHSKLPAADCNHRRSRVIQTAQALYQADGGILASERCIRAHLTAAQARGALLHEREIAQSWRVLSVPTLCWAVTEPSASFYACTQRSRTGPTICCDVFCYR